MSDIKWIKLATSFISSTKIGHIRDRKGGDTMALLWVLLLCRAGIVNDGGKVYIAPGVPYTNAGLAKKFGMAVKVVDEAMQLYVQLGMVTVKDGVIEIVNWSAHQNVDGMERAREKSRESSRRYREKHRPTPPPDDHGDVTGDGEVTHGDGTDKEREEDIDYQKELGIDNAYKTSSRARARTAQLIADEIVARRLLPGNLPMLHDAISEALARGYTPNGVVREAIRADGDWGSFAAAMMCGETEVEA